MLFCIFYCKEQLGSCLLGNAGQQSESGCAKYSVQVFQDSSHRFRKDSCFKGIKLGTVLSGFDHSMLVCSGFRAALYMNMFSCDMVLERPAGISRLAAWQPAFKCSTQACFQLLALSYCLTSVHHIMGQMLFQKYHRLIRCTVPYIESQHNACFGILAMSFQCLLVYRCNCLSGKRVTE